MKVLLCEDVKDLGWLGDIVEVSTGYARNYLLPQGLASMATEANIKVLAKDKAKRAQQRTRDHKRLKEAAAKVEGAEAVLAARANEQGVLFGSVGAGDIAGNLREQGFEVADEVVQLSENIKQVGTSEVTLKFADELTATVSVVVVAAGEDIAETPLSDTSQNGDPSSVKEAEDEPSASPQESEQEETKTEEN